MSESPLEKAQKYLEEMGLREPKEEPESIEETTVDPVQAKKLEVLELMKEQIKTDSSLAELGAILKKYPFVKDYLLQYVAALNYLGKGSITNLMHTVKCEPISDDKVQYSSQFAFYDKDGKQVFPEEFTKIFKSE